MLDPEELARALDVRDRAYRLLKWLNHALQRETDLFSDKHGALEGVQAAEAWLTRHRGRLPVEAAPRSGGQR